MRVLRPILVILGLVTVAACSAPQQVHVPPSQVAAPIPNTAAIAPIEDMSGLPRSFTVYFDHDSAEIRASAMQVLWEATQVATKLQPATIRVNGFTDGSGRRPYNQKLSDRRAAAVAVQLVKLGIRVTVMAKGHGADQQVAKAKATRKDARDRRVELTFEGGHAMGPASSAAASGEPTAQMLSVADAPHPAPSPAAGTLLAQCSTVIIHAPIIVRDVGHENIIGIIPHNSFGTGPPL